MRTKRPPRDIHRVSRAAIPIAAVVAAALALLLAARLFPRFADGYNRTVGAAIRGFLAHLTSWFPFSLAEWLLYAVPLLVVGVAVYAYRRRSESWRTLFVYILDIVLVFGLLFALFAFSFGTGYCTTPLSKRLALEKAEVNAENLAAVAALLSAALAEQANGVAYGEDGFSVMPYDMRELNEKLMAAYRPVCETYPFLQTLNSRVKPVLASKAMSYTHVTGVYTYFTGEANVNVHFPDYTLPFTAAHELAHQRGIAREQEANFVAYLVCAASDDPYLRYSGTLNLFEYVLVALRTTDEEAYRAVVSALDARVLGELRAYSAFFEKYRGAKAANVSEKVNDTYLKLQGSSAGTGSYALVVELAVSYFSAADSGEFSDLS